MTVSRAVVEERRLENLKIRGMGEMTVPQPSHGWTYEHDEYLRRHFADLSHKDIGLRLGKTERAVRNRCHRIGLRKNAAEWTEAEDAVLRACYAAAANGPVQMADIARRIGRTPPAIAARAGRLGLSHYGRNRGEGFGEVFAARMKEHIKRNGHPRGMAGKNHTEEARAAMSVGQKALWDSGTHGALAALTSQKSRQRRSEVMVVRMRGENQYSRCKRGRRADIGEMFFKSAWEANYARYLRFLVERGEIREWAYEPETFWFLKIKRGVRSYTPDFRIVGKDGERYFVEVKGWMDKKSQTKMKHMKKYHPEVEVRLVDAKAYREIAKMLGSAIPNWEF